MNDEATGVVEFGVKENTTGVSGTFSYNFGESLTDAEALFGPEVVHNKFKQASVISAATFIRSCLKAGKDGTGGKTLEEAQAALDAWKPGIGAIRSKKDPVAALADAIGKLSPEEQAKSRDKLEALLASMID